MSFNGVKIVIKKISLVLTALLISVNLANAAAPDSKGTDFWLMFSQNVNPPQLQLFITGDVSTSGNVSIPGLSFSQNFNVTPGTVTRITNIPSTAQVGTGNGLENKGIHVTSGNEVTVYGLNRASFTSDAYLGLPTDILGTEYFALGHSGGSGEFFAVVATVDNTIVTITRPGLSPSPVTLNTGQVYQLIATSLSGTLITSDKPVAVFGGNRCASIPAGFGACDHIVEQLPPTETWGKSFVTIPLANRSNGDTFRFLASTDGTNVTVNGTLDATLNRGQFRERIITSSAVITSDKPILVAQYSNGCNFDPPCGATDGDPFMMLIPPFEQFLNQYTVSTADDTSTNQFPANFINVVAPTAAVGSITLDGSVIPSASFTPIGSSGFSGAQVPVSRGSHNLSGPLPFGAFIYGFGSFDSYGYPGGLSLAPVARVTGLSLAPKTATSPVGTQHCLVATVTDQNNEPLEGVRVDFNVSGANTTGGFANAQANGQAQFCYTGESPGQDTIEASVGDIADTATIDWTGGGNTPPLADPQSVTLAEDTLKAITLTGSDADGDSLTFKPNQPSHGTLTPMGEATRAQISRARRQLKARLQKDKKVSRKQIATILESLAGKTYLYAPDPNYNGPDSFTFVVNDGEVDSAPATVDITVTPVNDPPELLSREEGSAFEGRTYGTPGIAAVLKFRDIDGGDSSVGLTITSLRAKNIPKGCGAEVFPSDEVTFAPPNISESVPLVGDPDFEDPARVKGEIKTVEIGPAAMNAATAHGCHVTLVVTDFHVQRTGDPTREFSGSACIDSDDPATIRQSCSSAATLVSRTSQTSGSGPAIKIAPPRVR